MKRSRLLQDDGIAHTRKSQYENKQRKKHEAHHHEVSQEEIDVCLNCPRSECRPNQCTRLVNVCKNCKHIMYSDCYAECSKGYIEGIVHAFDTCPNFEKWRNK